MKDFGVFDDFTDHSYEGIFQRLKRHGAQIALETANADGEILQKSYREMTLEAERAGGALSQMIPAGGFVAVKLPNSMHWPVIYWAVLLAGCNVLLLDARSEEKAAIYLMRQAGAAIIITDDAFAYQGYHKIAPSEILNRDSAPSERRFGRMTALCTSGTTGVSRIFVYDDRAVSSQLQNTRAVIEADETKSMVLDQKRQKMRQLAFLPFHHIFGFMAVYMWFSFLGASMVFPREKTPEGIMEACRVHHVTHIFCVSLFWNNVAQGILRKIQLAGDLKKKQFEVLLAVSLGIQKGIKMNGARLMSTSVFKSVQQSLFGSDIRFLISGGGYVLPETLRILNAVGYPLHNGFGMTETGITSVDLSADVGVRMNGNVGRPFSSIDYRIDDTGEIVVSGDSIFSGQMVNGKYVPRLGKWFSTGDIGRMEQGRLFIEGRLKEVIINASGENVYPDELEDYFTQVDSVRQLCVTGVSTRNYEDISLVLSMERMPSREQALSIAKRIVEINASLPMYKRVDRVYLCAEPLPTANGIKIQRQKIRDLIEQGEFLADELDLASGKLLSKEQEPQRQEQAITDALYKAICEEVRGIFAEVLYLSREQIRDDAHFVTDLGGDSLSVIGVIAQLEEKYGVEITDADFGRAVNVKEIAAVIYNKIEK